MVEQSGALVLSTWLVAATSTSARPASVCPDVQIQGDSTRVHVEQATAVDPTCLGELAGHVRFEELRHVDAALRRVLDL